MMYLYLLEPEHDMYVTLNPQKHSPAYRTAYNHLYRKFTKAEMSWAISAANGWDQVGEYSNLKKSLTHDLLDDFKKYEPYLNKAKKALASNAPTQPTDVVGADNPEFTAWIITGILLTIVVGVVSVII